MQFLYDDSPIVACSSGNTSNCAIAVIRFSGFKDLSIFSKFLSIPVKNIKARKAHYCDLIHNGELVDQVVAVFFKGPNSYNGENVLELSVHGNTLNVDRILDLFTEETNFRLAQPGEFSYRALKNKKLNLSQIEGLDLLLNANSAFSLQQGFSLMNGGLQKSYLDLHKKYLNHRSSVELSIDFLEDIGEEEGNRQLEESFSLLIDSIKRLERRVRGDSSKLLNPEIVLVGQPNSGKSTFFNALLGEERSIVTNIAGTTRDFITETVNLEGINFRLVDTAGIRQSKDKIEMEGVKRALDLVESGFLKILLVNPFEFNPKYFEILNDVVFDVVIVTHSDLEGFKDALENLFSIDSFQTLVNESELVNLSEFNFKDLNAQLFGNLNISNLAGKSGPMGAEKSGPMGAEKSGSIGAEKNESIGKNIVSSCNNVARTVICSLKVGESQVIDLLTKLADQKYSQMVTHEPILLKRHKQKILEISGIIDEYGQLLSEESDISIISSELNNIGHCISELIGIVSPDDVLHNIFDNFCIGK